MKKVHPSLLRQYARVKVETQRLKSQLRTEETLLRGLARATGKKVAKKRGKRRAKRRSKARRKSR